MKRRFECVRECSQQVDEIKFNMIVATRLRIKTVSGFHISHFDGMITPKLLDCCSR